MQTAFSKKFGLRLPLIVAPMGGGYTTADLVSASCEAGALGSLAAAYLSPTDIIPEAKKIRAKTAKAFSVNLFTPMPEITITAEQIHKALAVTRKFREEFELGDPEVKPPFHPNFDEQFKAVLEIKPAAFSFIFGLLDQFYIKECRARGIFVMGTATTWEEAEELVATGVDAVVAQGTEAGGHRGIFDAKAVEPGVTTEHLVRQLSGKLKVPVIAAGGVSNGQDIVCMLKAGAQAVQMGTAFMLCPESATQPPHRRVLAERKGNTELTRVFSGRLARGIPNKFMNELKAHIDELLPFPAQNQFTRDLRRKSAQRGSPDAMSLWAGSAYAKIREGLSAAQLIAELESEMIAAMK